MLMHNFTPFSCFRFVSRNPDDRVFHVAILRGAFDLAPKRLLEPCADQEPVVTVDQYFDQAHNSSLAYASDLVPYKVHTDIALIGEAHAPRGEPRRSWDVQLRLGRLSKKLKVHGPRNWQYSALRGWHLSEAEPSTRVPIRYELAYGGQAEHGVCSENPVGRGFASSRTTRKSLPAPQIESPFDPVTVFGKSYEPEGFGLLARHWKPRSAFAGTYDEAWQKTRSPGMPLDFDDRFYSAARTDMIYRGFLDGNETGTLQNLDPGGQLDFQLPCVSPWLLVRHKSGHLQALGMVLDTILIDAISRKVYLTWRFFFRHTHPVRALEFHVKAADGRNLG